MIDARDYPTTEELSEAMEFERNVATVEFIRKTCAYLKVCIWKHEFEIERIKSSIEYYKMEMEKLEQKIDEFHIKQRERRRNEHFVNSS